jgi:ketosteroid isomerase-like protein
MSIAQAFAEAFNRRDVDALLDCFTEHASYVDTFFGEHAGRAGLRAMFEPSLAKTTVTWSFTAMPVSSSGVAAKVRFIPTLRVIQRERLPGERGDGSMWAFGPAI